MWDGEGVEWEREGLTQGGVKYSTGVTISEAMGTRKDVGTSGCENKSTIVM